MDQSLTIRTDQYAGEWVENRLRWAMILNLLQAILGQPRNFYARDFLISFEFDHEILAVFCSQGRRRGEVVISTDSRNPHAHLVGKIEEGIQRFRESLRQDADEEPDNRDEDDYDEDDYDEEDDE